MTAITTTENKALLRAKLLTELVGGKRRTTRQLALLLEVDSQAVYRALVALEEEGTVESFVDRRRASQGEGPGVSRVWSLTGVPAPFEPPPRDPLLWALYGGQP